MPLLSEANIAERLKSVPAWRVESGELVRTVVCTNFRAALALVNRVGDLAESAGHHPDIAIRYDKVRFALVTHDENGLTATDFALAREIDKLL